MKVKFILSLITLFLFPGFVSAYTITGKVLNTKKELMTGASVVLYKDTATIVSSAIADTNGQFSLSTNVKGNIKVRVSMIGWLSSNITFESYGKNVDLGNIVLKESSTMLNEVEIVAQNVVEKGSNYIVFPTAKEIKSSGTSLELLESMQYKLPGLQVNSSLGKITIENGSAIFQINGRQVDMARILSLNNDNILRIEYSNVSDIRYGTSVMGVINYITKPTTKGGSVLVNAIGGIGLTNANIGTTFNYGKSEWTLDYGNSWRNFKKVYNTGTESFIGGKMPIIRTSYPTPSSLKYMINNLAIGYTYMYNPATMFAVTISGKSTSTSDKMNMSISQTFDKGISEYMSMSNDKSNKLTPNLDLYFRRQLNNTSKLEFNAYGNYISADIDKKLNYESTNQLYTQFNVTDNKSWRAGAEALYTKIYKNIETKYGVNYYHNYAENIFKQNENNTQISKQANDNLYVYGSIAGRLNKVTYSVGVGGRYFKTDNNKYTQNTFKISGKATINYKIDKKWSLNYLFMLDPSMPSLSSQSKIVQRVDDITLQMGNPKLKASTYFRNRVYLRYATPKINISLWAAYSRNLNSIYNHYSYITDTTSPYFNMFMSQCRNAKHDDLLNFELQMGYTGIKNLMLYGTAGWDRYTFSGFGNIEPFGNFYANVTVAYVYKNLKLSGRFEIKPRYSLSGNIMKTPERCNAIMAQYKWRDFWFTAGVFNPFSNRGVMYKTKELSSVHPVNNNFYIQDGANMFTLGVTYRINLGHGFKKVKKGLKNEGVDTGENYKSKAEIKL